MDIVVARIIHVLAIVMWIGGVGFVTTVLFPAVRRSHEPEARLAAFMQYEARFVWQARISGAVAGLSGLYMIWRREAWPLFVTPGFLWLDAMVLFWLVFATILFVIEPLSLSRRMARAVAAGASAPLFDRMELFHRILLALSLVIIFGAVGGSNGLFE